MILDDVNARVPQNTKSLLLNSFLWCYWQYHLAFIPLMVCTHLQEYTLPNMLLTKTTSKLPLKKLRFHLRITSDWQEQISLMSLPFTINPMLYMTILARVNCCMLQLHEQFSQDYIQKCGLRFIKEALDYNLFEVSCDNDDTSTRLHEADSFEIWDQRSMRVPCMDSWMCLPLSLKPKIRIIFLTGQQYCMQ